MVVLAVLGMVAWPECALLRGIAIVVLHGPNELGGPGSVIKDGGAIPARRLVESDLDAHADGGRVWILGRGPQTLGQGQAPGFLLLLHVSLPLLVGIGARRRLFGLFDDGGHLLFFFL